MKPCVRRTFPWYAPMPLFPTPPNGSDSTLNCKIVSFTTIPPLDVLLMNFSWMPWSERWNGFASDFLQTEVPVLTFWKEVKCQRFFPSIDEFNSFRSWIDVDDWKNRSKNFFLHHGILRRHFGQNGQINVQWWFVWRPTWIITKIVRK